MTRPVKHQARAPLCRPRPRVERLPVPRLSQARVYHVLPGHWDYSMAGWPGVTMEVRIAPTQRAMRAAIIASGAGDPGPDCGGMCASVIRVSDNSITRNRRGRIATIFLNEEDLIGKPSEVLAHEATHAAMVFCRYRGVDPMAGMGQEEVLAYTVGVLVRQLNKIFYAHAFRRPRR